MVGDSGVFEEQAAPAGGVDFGTSYDTGSLDMPAVLMRPSLAGDCNLDGRVDVNDLTIVLANYGQTSGVDWNRGDLNGDGKVDVNDLTIVLANYNRTAASAGAAGSVSAVPEPLALVLIGLGEIRPDGRPPSGRVANDTGGAGDIGIWGGAVGCVKPPL